MGEKTTTIDEKTTTIDEKTTTIDEKTTTMDEKTTTKIIELITDNAQISRQGLADALGISLFGVDWQIRKLKADGILKREGNNRSGKWIIVK